MIDSHQMLSSLGAFAPEISGALARKSGHTDIATQALAAAEQVYKRVEQTHADRIEIVAIVARAIYLAAAREREAQPAREAQAVRAALEGAESVMRTALRRLIEQARP